MQSLQTVYDSFEHDGKEKRKVEIEIKLYQTRKHII